VQVERVAAQRDGTVVHLFTANGRHRWEREPGKKTRRAA